MARWTRTTSAPLLATRSVDRLLPRVSSAVQTIRLTVACLLWPIRAWKVFRAAWVWLFQLPVTWYS